MVAVRKHLPIRREHKQPGAQLANAKGPRACHVIAWAEGPCLEFGHFESADVPLQSPFSRHFVAHFAGTDRVRVKCSITKNCWQGNATQDQRHGGGVLNPERQSEGQSPQLLDSSRTSACANPALIYLARAHPLEDAEPLDYQLDSSSKLTHLQGCESVAHGCFCGASALRLECSRAELAPT
jgi:hypothetical protein